ncbi:MAG: EamA family transporter [Casimicrobiaceae bacterium]
MGELAAVVSTLCFAAANVTITRGAARDAADNGAFLSILMTAALAALAMLVFRPPQGAHDPNLAGVAWFAASGLLTVFVGRVFLYASVQHLGAVRASAVKRLNPVFSVLLGITLLGEPVGLSMAVGMTLIFVSFGMLAMESWRSLPVGERETRRGALRSLANLGYFYGPVSALAYATGYLARKQGLLAMPDPNFGTFIGAVAGAVTFVIAGCFVASYRAALVGTFRRFNPWLWAAAVLASIGQILQFVALNTMAISRVALIASLEVIATMLFSVWLLRRRESMGVMTIAAALLSVAGAALVIRY